jgi:hypothetical protein
MKNRTKLAAILITLGVFTSCSVKTSSTTSSTGSGTSPISTDSGGSGSGGSGSGGSGSGGSGSGGNTFSCDGVARAGVTKCYYKNIPTVVASGGTYGQTWWSSANYVAATGSDPKVFSSDATFNVRVIPRVATTGSTSTFNKTCSTYMTYATKLKVQLMLHRNGVSVGEIATLTADMDSPSKVWHFTVPASSDPLVLEVVNVLSDSRCSGKYGTKLSTCTTNPYYDIPINTRGPTECVAFDLQFSTDETYDLPGASAN